MQGSSCRLPASRMSLHASAGGRANAGIPMPRPLRVAAHGILAPGSRSGPARGYPRRSDATRTLAARQDREADVVIIGAGVAGLSAALTLHK